MLIFLLSMLCGTPNQIRVSPTLPAHLDDVNAMQGSGGLLKASPIFQTGRSVSIQGEVIKISICASLHPKGSPLSMTMQVPSTPSASTSTPRFPYIEWNHRIHLLRHGDINKHQPLKPAEIENTSEPEVPSSIPTNAFCTHAVSRRQDLPKQFRVGDAEPLCRKPMLDLPQTNVKGAH